MDSHKKGGLLLAAAYLALCASAGSDHLDFPKTPADAIVEEDLAFSRALASLQHPHPPAQGWQGPLSGAPAGMMVWGKIDSSGGNPAAKFFIVGSVANVSVEAMIATVEGSDFMERVRWDPSCLVLSTLGHDAGDEVVHWRTDFPWPLSDREFVYRRRVQRDGQGGAVSVNKAIKASSAWVPVESSVIRIRDFIQHCSVSPLQDGSGVSIAMLYRNNMEANLPQWVVNWFASVGLPQYLGQLVSAARSWRGPSSPSPHQTPSPASKDEI